MHWTHRNVAKRTVVPGARMGQHGAMDHQTHDTDDKGPRGYHDIGGAPAGAIPRVDLPWQHWEKQVEAIRGLLGDGTRRIVSLDEVRRGFETFGLDKYNTLSFYRRRLEAMTDILVEKGVVSQADLEAAIARERARWPTPQPQTRP